MTVIHKITTDQDIKIWLSIRQAVFFEELGVPKFCEENLFQDGSYFFLAKMENKPAGIGRYRLLEEIIKFEWIATLKPYRKQGIGEEIIVHMLEQSLKDFPNHLPLMNARCAVLPLYEKRGWLAVGKKFVFFEGGLEHRKMVFLRSN